MGDLASHAARLDQERYVEHPALAGLLAGLLRPDSDTRVLFLHGPGGVGKSAALRALARGAAGQGYAVRRLDAREMGLVPDLGGPDEQGRPLLVVVDEADALGPGLTTVGRLTAALPDDTRLAVAGRRVPPGRWLPDVLLPLSQTVRVQALPPEEAAEVLSRYQVEPDRRPGILSWARGSPLALVVAATSGTSARSEALARILTGYALDSLDRELLEAASLTWAVDEELLATLLPDRDPASALQELLAHTVVERRGDRALLHPLLAREIAEQLAVEDPFRHAVLVLRLASVLRERALAGAPTALTELAELLRDPALRHSLGVGSSDRYVADRVRSADHAAVRGQLGPIAEHAWSYLERLLEQGFAIRDRDATCLSVTTIHPATSLTDPTDPIAGPPADYAREQGIADRAVVTSLLVTLRATLPEGTDLRELQRVRGGVTVQRSGIVNPRYDLVNEWDWGEAEVRTASTVGYREIEQLRREIGGRQVRTWMLDSGPGGLVGLVYRTVAQDHGVELPPPASRGAQVLTALDGLWDDQTLVGLELAPLGHTTTHTAREVRRLVRRQVTRALAGRPELLELVEARFLTAPGVSHDEVIGTLYLSRATYFRRLKEARALIAADP